MIFGMCGSASLVPQIKSAGFDFFEAKLRDIGGFSKDEFEKEHAFIKQSGITPYCFNCFFPDGTRLTGDVDFEKIKEYLLVALSRAKALGGKLAVLGNGKLRNIPQGMTKAQALAQFMEVARLCGDIAAQNDMKIAIEPLRTKETDIINTVQDGIDFCCALGHSNVGLLVDFFHVFCNNENIDEIENVGDYLLHVHLARPNADRGAPREEDREILKKWSAFLQKNGYNGTLSLEIKKSENVEDDLASLALLKEIF